MNRAFLCYVPKGVIHQRACQEKKIILGWESILPRSLEVATVPGDHQNMLKPPHAATLAENLEKHLKGERELGQRERYSISVL